MHLGEPKEKSGELTVTYREKSKENVGCSHFPVIKPFLKVFEWQQGLLRISVSCKTGNSRSHAQRTGFVSFRCINQELLRDKIKMLSRTGKQEFIEQGISLGLITMLMGFPLLETYGYNPCKP